MIEAPDSFGAFFVPKLLVFQGKNSMLLKAIVYAYSTNIYSGRRMASLFLGQHMEHTADRKTVSDLGYKSSGVSRSRHFHNLPQCL